MRLLPYQALINLARSLKYTETRGLIIRSGDLQESSSAPIRGTFMQQPSVIESKVNDNQSQSMAPCAILYDHARWTLPVLISGPLLKSNRFRLSAVWVGEIFPSLYFIPSFVIVLALRLLRLALKSTRSFISNVSITSVSQLWIMTVISERIEMALLPTINHQTVNQLIKFISDTVD